MAIEEIKEWRKSPTCSCQAYLNIDTLLAEINRLKGELEETNELSKKECREHVLFAHATGERIGALERQLTEARAENERLRDKLSDAYDDHCDSH